MTAYREIPKISLPSGMSNEYQDALDQMLKAGLDSNLELSNRIMEIVESDLKDQFDRYNKAIDVEFKKVYDQAIAEGIIKGKPTRAKFTKAGYDVCYHDGVGVYIRRNGQRVSDIVNY